MKDLDIEKITEMDNGEVIEKFKEYERSILQKQDEIEKLNKENQNFIREFHSKDKEIYDLKKKIKSLNIERLGELNASIVFQKVSSSQLTHKNKSFLSNSICNILEIQKSEIINSLNIEILNGNNDLPF